MVVELPLKKKAIHKMESPSFFLSPTNENCVLWANLYAAANKNPDFNQLQK